MKTAQPLSFAAAISTELLITTSTYASLAPPGQRLGLQRGDLHSGRYQHLKHGLHPLLV